MNEFPRRLTAYTVVLAGVVVAVGTVLAIRGPRPDLVALALFAALVFFAERRSVLIDGTMYLSGSTMVGMAAVIVFTDQATLLGPLIVGAASGLHLPRYQRRMLGWIPFNGSQMGVAYLVAAVVWSVLPAGLTGAFPGALVGGLVAATAYVLVNVSLVVLSYFIEDPRGVRSVVTEMTMPGLQTIPFALLGVFLGRLYLELGAAVAVLIVVPVLVARELYQSYLDVKAANEDTLKVLIRALEAKDRYTAGHSERVATYARYIGEEFQFTPWRLERLRIAALCHDIGKLVVPNQLLNKPGKLTEEEFRRVKLHEQVTVEMLSRVDVLAPLAPSTSHEASQYRPDDRRHPIEPYIIAVADAFDAMTSTRSYRRALPQEVAFEELRDKSGTQFHPDCAEALIRAIERRDERHGAGEVEDDIEHFHIAPPVSGVGSAGLGDFATDSVRRPVVAPASASAPTR